MGNQSRNEQLVEHYLRVAGVAAVWIGPDGHIGAEDVAPLHLAPDRIAYCCPRGGHFVLAYRLQLWMQEQPAPSDQAAVATRLEQLAVEGGVVLTPRNVIVEHALEAVARIDRTFDDMLEKGELREINAAFKAARKADRSLRYHDYLHAEKVQMLNEIAGSGT